MELHSKDTLHNRTKYKTLLITDMELLGPLGLPAEGIVNFSGACRATIYRHLRRWTHVCHYFTRTKRNYRWHYKITDKGRDCMLKILLRGYPVNVWRAEVNEWNKEK